MQGNITMAQQYRIIHFLNQFFGGLGGEEQAALAPRLLTGAKGPGNLMQNQFTNLKVVSTLVVGDNYLAENTARASREILDLLTPHFESGDPEARPQLLLAGPAFNAGRYGMACGAICKAVSERFAIPSVTGMYQENPAIAEYRQHVYIARTSDDVMGMGKALESMVTLGLKLVKQEAVLPEQDGYIPQGRRRNYFSSETGAKRAVDMLLKKIKGEPFVTEYPMPVFDRVKPAPALKDPGRAKFGLVTSGGIVPRGNPDRIEAANAHCFGTYSLQDLTAFTSQTHQTAHGGYDPTFANENPNRVLPLDVVRELESEGEIGELHETYYATVGNATSVASARKFGQEIAKNLLADGVQAVILTST